ncbi:tesmin isoform 3-T3 [Guaruba guarouba]
MSMEISFDIIDSGLVTVIFSQNNLVSSENLNLETVVIHNPIEEGLCSSQDNHLCTVNVEETLLDHFKYPLTNENQDTVMKVEEQPHGNSSCDEDLENYKELNLPEEAEHMHSPYLPSDGVPLLSSVVMQNKNSTVPTSSVFSPEGTASQNVREIPVFRSFMPPVAGENKGICSDQFEEIQNSTMQLQNLTNSLNESASDIYGLPQTSASVYGEIVICQLEGGTQTLCINSCGTQELKPVHLISEYHNQHNYVQSDVDYPVTAVLGQISPLLGELVLNEQKACLDRNPAAFLPKIEKRKLREIKPHHNKGCNCKRSECLKNYCECFEVRQAKIMCSSICKCIGCKNYEETPDEKTQSNMLNYMDFGNNEENSPVLTSTFKMLPKSKKDRQPVVCISWEEVKAVCACLLVQAQEAEERGYSVCLAEQMIMEEFGRCLSQILRA